MIQCLFLNPGTSNNYRTFIFDSGVALTIDAHRAIFAATTGNRNAPAENTRMTKPTD
jgi:hypothetical protein